MINSNKQCFFLLQKTRMAVFAERDNLDRQQLALKYSQLKGIFEGKDGGEYNSGIYNR